MIPEKFLEMGRRIVAEHKAQYQGVYYMKGGFLGEVLSNPITEVLSDVVATATGNPELIPLINGAETASGDLVRGQSLGKSLAQGALSGGEALAEQEALGAVGIGQGNTAFNNALGITGDNPLGTGLPDIGNGISNLFGSSSSTPGAATTSAGAVNGANAGGSPLSSAPAGGAAGSAAGAAAPAGVAGTGGDVTLNAGGSSPGTQGIPSDAGSSFDSAAKAAGVYNPNALSATAANIPSPISSDVPAAAPQSFGSQIVSGLKNSIAQNPLGIGAAALGIGGDALKQSGLVGNNVPKGQNQVENIAAQENQQGQQLQGYLQSGTLPPGLQQTLNQATEAAKASIRSKYAASGSSGSSAEQQELAAVDSNAQGQESQLALQLLNTGINETGMASQLYQQLMKNSITQDNQLGTSIANFASAAGGGGTNVNALLKNLSTSTQPGA